MERRVGFAGCYSHDVILLLAKVLTCMEKKVLLVDRNKRHTLRASIPVPEGLCTGKEKIEYDGLFYTEQESSKVEREKYDIELIDFGMEIKEDAAFQCTEIIVVTDMLLHHIHALSKEPIPKERVRACVIRDVMHGIYRKEAAMKAFLHSFPNRAEFFLPPDVRDMRNRYVCEMMQEYSLKRASPEMQEAVLQIAGALCPGYSEKEIHQRVKLRERRQYR